MVDGVVLVVDATEGPMTQTRFVLQKALTQHLIHPHLLPLKPLVVINKADRSTARIPEVEEEILELFINLNASDMQLDYKTLYASAKDGWAVENAEDVQRIIDGKYKSDMKCVLDMILGEVPPPDFDRTRPFSMLVTQLESDPYVGKCYLGRIASGTIKVGDKIRALNSDGVETGEGKVVKLFARDGLERVAINEAGAGDIISIAGLSAATVNSTLCAGEHDQVIPSVPIDPPTVSMTFSVNDSPLQGKEGSKLTSSMIADRLFQEVETNVAMQVFPSPSNDAFEVRGRGELHLGILIENMRREGFELSISPPRVILKRDKDKSLLEPMEEAVLDVPLQYAGSVITKLNKRKGEMKEYNEVGDRVKLVFEIPSRGLLGYGSEFKNETSGQGILNHMFIGYRPYKGEVDKARKGSLIATATGTVTSHAILGIEPRGTMFIKAGDTVYPGMVVGEHNKDNDLEVNAVKAKQLTNVRAVSKDDFVRTSPPRVMALEQVLSYIQDDEIIEVTPKSIRIRKRVLDGNMRRSKVYNKPQDNLLIDEQ